MTKDLPPGWEKLLGLKPKKPKTPAEEAADAFRKLSLQFPPSNPKQ